MKNGLVYLPMKLSDLVGKMVWIQLAQPAAVRIKSQNGTERLFSVRMVKAKVNSLEDSFMNLSTTHLEAQDGQVFEQSVNILYPLKHLGSIQLLET